MPRDQELWTLDQALAQLSGPPSSEGPTEALHLALASEGVQLFHLQLITADVWGHPAYDRCY